MLMPVVLPPGRASDATNPCPTMSSVNERIGIVRVAACAARAAAAPPAKMASHDWRKVKTAEEAESIAVAARNEKNPAAVMSGRRRWALRKNKNRYRKPVPTSVPKTSTETPNSPVPETGTTGSGRKPVLLSISRGGGHSLPAASTSAPEVSLTDLVLGIAHAQLDELEARRAA